MGVYDSINVPCPNCGEKQEFQTKSGPCLLQTFELETAPDDVLDNVNRHAPATCDKCNIKFGVDITNRRPVIWPSGGTEEVSAYNPMVKVEKDIRPFVTERMAAMYKTPHMWAYTKEAFVAQVTLLLELMGANDPREFMLEILPHGSNITAIQDGFSFDWAQEVIRKAQHYL